MVFRRSQPISKFTCRTCGATHEVYLPLSLVEPCKRCGVGFAWNNKAIKHANSGAEIPPYEKKVIRIIDPDMLVVSCIYCGRPHEATKRHKTTCYECKVKRNRKRALYGSVTRQKMQKHGDEPCLAERIPEYLG